MWSFDVIKIVMASIMSGRNKIPKVSETHKVKVTVTFLKKQNIQDILPTALRLQREQGDDYVKSGHSTHLKLRRKRGKYLQQNQSGLKCRNLSGKRTHTQVVRERPAIVVSVR